MGTRSIDDVNDLEKTVIFQSIQIMELENRIKAMHEGQSELMSELDDVNTELFNLKESLSEEMKETLRLQDRIVKMQNEADEKVRENADDTIRDMLNIYDL